MVCVGTHSFPSGEGLRSGSSAGRPLFAAFIATMPSSDCSIPCITGFSVFRLPCAVPTLRLGQDRALPGPDEMRMYVHEVLDTVGLYAVSPLR